MTDHNPNRPVGSGVPADRDRLGGGTPPVPPRDTGNSAMALIVGALAVALIIGAFFWFAGDTQDTATLDDPAVTEETVTDDPDVTITEEETNTTTTMTTEEPADTTTTTTSTTEPVVTPEPATEEPESGEVIDETQQDTQQN